MDSQVLAAALGAGITAVTGVIATSPARRASSYRRHQLQDMRDEAELLATLPADHPMRAELSRIIEARLRGYARLFDRAVGTDTNPIVPRLGTLIGLALILISLIIDRWLGTFEYLAHLFAWDLDWENERSRRIPATVGILLLTLGLMLYFMGLPAITRWERTRRWKRAMCGDEIDRPSKKPRKKDRKDKVRWFGGSYDFDA